MGDSTVSAFKAGPFSDRDPFLVYIHWLSAVGREVNCSYFSLDSIDYRVKTHDGGDIICASVGQVPLFRNRPAIV